MNSIVVYYMRNWNKVTLVLTVNGTSTVNCHQYHENISRVSLMTMATKNSFHRYCSNVAW